VYARSIRFARSTRPLRGVIDGGGSQEPAAARVRLFVWHGRVKNSRRRPVRRPARGRCTGRGDAEEREMVVATRQRQAEVEAAVRFCDMVEDTAAAAAAVRLSARSPGNTPPPDKLQDAVAVAVQSASSVQCWFCARTAIVRCYPGSPRDRCHNNNNLLFYCVSLCTRRVRSPRFVVRYAPEGNPITCPRIVLDHDII